MKYQEFLQQIESGQIRPVYFLHGEEGLLIQLALDALKKALLSPGLEDFNYDLLDAPSLRTAELLDRCQTLPAFSEWRLVVVREVEALKNPEALIPYLEQPNQSTCLVLTAKKVDARKRVFIDLKTKSAEIHCAAVQEGQLSFWIRQFSSASELRFTPEAIRYFIERTGGSLFQIQTEIEKISLLFPKGHKIDIAELESSFSGQRSYSAFEWAGAIERGNRERAIQELSGLLDSGEVPLALLGLLLYRYRRAAKSQRSSNRPSPSSIQAFTHCLNADSRLKLSGLSPRLILEELTLTLCQKGKSQAAKQEIVKILSGREGGSGLAF